MTQQNSPARNLPVPVAPPRRQSTPVRGIAAAGLLAIGLLAAMYGITLHRADDEAAQHAMHQASLAATIQ